MIGSPGETVLPRRVHPQPTPFIVTGGDCGACVLGGALSIPLEQVYEIAQKKDAISGFEMPRLLYCAMKDGLADRVIDVPAEWQSHGKHWRSFGRPAYMESLAWFNYVRMAIDAGYYGLATVDFKRKGGIDTDHWVLICGARTMPITNGGRITGEVLVSCSARNSGMQDEWVDARDFLQYRGGYDILFVRPSK